MQTVLTEWVRGEVELLKTECQPVSIGDLYEYFPGFEDVCEEYSIRNVPAFSSDCTNVVHEEVVFSSLIDTAMQCVFGEQLMRDARTRVYCNIGMIRSRAMEVARCVREKYSTQSPTLAFVHFNGDVKKYEIVVLFRSSTLLKNELAAPIIVDDFTVVPQLFFHAH